ncbi:unnamed protein product [Amoebophrya sp. A25]|nr:unnamed protein product [Amoebophrya sp. A25]|eukprot:GSA25T00020466001.1
MLAFLIAGLVSFSTSWAVFGWTLEACSVWCWSAGFYALWSAGFIFNSKNYSAA